ncbi:DUF6197 family protein [Streptomyces odonnellii]|uniref:DUF6197 family protein n=1 Tax=Streptomyces odonnellii TaxID=1417980 RepID=UPI0006265274|nr:hypothetical protein [Streptomyces odonnellii]
MTAPGLTRTPTTTAQTEPSAHIDLETRMAAVEAAMTIRLETAALTVDVNSAHIPLDHLDLPDVVRVPVTAPPHPEQLRPYPTPVAALLQRAAGRMETSGWCAGGTTDETGAVCLYGAIHKEAPTDSLESDALDLLLDTIRRRFGPSVESVPAFNDAHADARVPLRLLRQAADRAHTCGI